MILAIRTRGRFIKTFLLSILAFILLGTALEVLARSPLPRETLLTPSLGMPNRIEESTISVKLAYLERLRDDNGSIDCLFVGSSMIDRSINIEAFTQSYKDVTGEELTCFNFGIGKLAPDLGVWLTEYLIQTFQPRFVVYGIGIVEYSRLESPAYRYLPESEWFLYTQGKFNLRGWLIAHSYAYRYYLRYSDWISPEFKQTLKEIGISESLYSATGSRIQDLPALVNVNDIPSEENEYDKRAMGVFGNFQVADYKLDALEQIVQLGQTYDTKIMILEVPVHLSFMHLLKDGMATYQQIFIQPIAEIARRHQVPFWELSDDNLFPESYLWWDRHHLNPPGSKFLGAWLGIQFGEAARQGLWENNASPDLLYNPPVAAPELPVASLFPTYGLLEKHYLTFQESSDYLDQFLDEGVVFTPEDVDFEKDVVNMGLSIQKGYLDADPGRFDMMALLERASNADGLFLTTEQREFLDNWSETKDPEELVSAGVDYLLYSEQWLSEQTGKDTTRLKGRDYHLIQIWQHPFNEEIYYLYQPVTEANQGINDKNLVINGDFQNGLSRWRQHGDMDASVKDDGLHLSRNAEGTSGWALITQELNYVVAPNTALRFSAEIGNPTDEKKTVRITLRQYRTEEKGAAFCDFTLPAGTPSQPYLLRTIVPGGWDNIELVISDIMQGDQTGATGTLVIDNVAVKFAPKAGITETDCIFVPANTNLVLNGDFQEGLTSWEERGDMMSYLEGDAVYFSRDVEGKNGWASITQDLNFVVAPGTGLTFSADVGNPADEEKTVRFMLRQPRTTEKGAAFCDYVLPAHSPSQSYKMRASTPQEWDNVEVIISDVTKGAQTGYAVVDNVVVEFIPESNLTEQDCGSASETGDFAPETDNLVTNGDFQNGLALWQQHGDMSAFVESNALHLSRDAEGTAGWAAITQDLGYTAAPGTILKLSAELGNPTTEEKRVRFTLRQRRTDEQGLAICEFTLTPQSAAQTYALKAAVPQEWENVQVMITDLTGSDQTGETVLDNVAVTVITESAITDKECTVSEAGEAPASANPESEAPVSTGSNLVLNGDFQEVLAPWKQAGDMVSYLEDDVVYFSRDPDGTNGWASITQDVNQAVAAGTVVKFSADIGNPSEEEKKIRFMLRQRRAQQGMVTCDFILPPGSAPQSHSLIAPAPEEWNIMEVIISDLTDSDQTSYAVLDNVTVSIVTGSAITEKECTVSEAGEAPASASSENEAPVSESPESEAPVSDSPQGQNLVLNGDFQEALAPWKQAGDMVSYLEDDVVYFSRDPDGAKGWASITQDVNRVVAAGTVVKFSADIGNPSEEEKKIRLMLRQRHAQQGMVTCDFILPAGSAPQTHSLIAPAPEEWNIMEVIISDLTDSDQTSYAVLDNATVSIVTDSTITEKKCTASPDSN